MSAAARLLRLARDRRGIAAVEFALVAPLLLTIAMGIAEVSRFVMLSLKVQHAATTLADLATREEVLSMATLDNLFDAVEHVVAPFEFGSDGVAIVSSVALRSNVPTVFWQERGAGSNAAASEIGTENRAADLPDGLVLRAGETVLAAEVVFQYRGWLLGLVPDGPVRRAAYYRPRLGTLQEAPA